MKSLSGSSLIAPCGMNCGLCMGFLREKRRCPGCRHFDDRVPFSTYQCKIKHCDFQGKDKTAFCFRCKEFPCAKIKHLDKRYRARYHMSMIGNLENIRKNGIKKFLASEKKRWTCPACGGTVCVHRGRCYTCGKEYRNGN